MTVKFAALNVDGSQLIDGVHDTDVPDALATTILTGIGELTDVPGQDIMTMLLYDTYTAWQQSEAVLAMSQGDQDLIEGVRKAFRVALRIEGNQIAWRFV